MIRFWSIARNTFVQTIRQPVYGAILFVIVALLVLTSPLAGWTLGTGQGDYSETDQQMLLEMGLGTLLLGGTLVAGFCASAALSREIEDRTALTVLSKPVSRATFLAGKFAGVSTAVVLAYYLSALVLLMTARHRVLSSASDPYDAPVIVLGAVAAATALLVAWAGNFWFGWPFISAAVWTLTVTLTLAAGTLAFVGKGWQIVPPGYDKPPQEIAQGFRVEIDPDYSPGKFRQEVEARGYAVEKIETDRMSAVLKCPSTILPRQAAREARSWPGVAATSLYAEPPVIHAQVLLAILLMFLAVLVLCAVAIAASTRLGQVLTLLVCAAVLLAGSWHEYLFRNWSHRLLPAALAALATPRLTLFFPMDALAQGRRIPAGYLGLAAGYCALYIGGVLAIGVALFQRRALDSEGGSASMPTAAAILAWAGRLGAAVACLAGAEGYASLLWARANHSFEPAVFNFLAGLGGGRSLAIGLGAAGGLIVLGVAMWLFWGRFARGSQWTWWLTTVVAGAFVVAGVAAIAVPAIAQALKLSQPTWIGVAATCAAVLFVLFLSGTRRHFFPKDREFVNA